MTDIWEKLRERSRASPKSDTRREHIPVDISNKDGSWSYRNFVTMAPWEIERIDKIYFHYTRHAEKYGKGLNIRRRSEVTPKWIEDHQI